MTDVVVKSEPRVYGPGGPSYFQDRALAVCYGVPGHAEACERLNRYAQELDVEIAARSPEGVRAARKVVEHRRANTAGAPELRSGATSTTISSFTTPEYLTQYWAAYRSADRSFTDQTTKLPLPEYGLQVNVPSFSSATSFGTQTENSGASELDPSGVNIQATLSTQAGIVSISQQLYDRGGWSGEAFDKILLRQMKSQLDAQIDSYVLTAALANAGSVSDATFSVANFLADIATARELLSDTAGVRLLATHLFSTSDLFGYVTRQLDTSGTPILSTDSGALVLASQVNDPEWNSWTGVHLGQVRWHTDDNIPAKSSNTQIIVARPAEVYTFDGDDMVFCYPETQSEHLSVVIGLYAYVGVVVRFNKAISVITGNAYPTSLV